MNVSVGSCCPELAQAHSSVALAWHQARGSTPFGVTIMQRATWPDCEVRSDVQCLGLVMLAVGGAMNSAKLYNRAPASGGARKISLGASSKDYLP